MNKIQRLARYFKKVVKISPTFLLTSILSELLEVIKPFILLYALKVLTDTLLENKDFRSTFLLLIIWLSIYFGISLLASMFLSMKKRSETLIRDNLILEKSISIASIPYEIAEGKEVTEKKGELSYLEQNGLFNIIKVIEAPSVFLSHVLIAIFSFILLIPLLMHGISSGNTVEILSDILFLFLIIFTDIFSYKRIHKHMEETNNFVRDEVGKELRMVAAKNDYVYDLDTAPDVRFFTHKLVIEGAKEGHQLSTNIFTSFWKGITKTSVISSTGNAVIFILSLIYVATKIFWGVLTPGDLFLF